MTPPINVAIVGCGWAGKEHARSAAERGLCVTWAVDTDRERAHELLAWAPKAHTAGDMAAALDDAQVDAVSLCLPHNLHAPLAIQALRAGKHVLVEKPLAANLAQADEMIRAAEAARRVLMVAENVCYDPALTRVRGLIEGGAIGQPVVIQRERHCYLCESFLRDRPWFLNEKAAAGGIMMSGGIHDFELMRMLMGPVAAVCAERAPQRFSEMQGDDTSLALVRFTSGALGVLVESFISKSLSTVTGTEVHTLRIDGSLGCIRLGDGMDMRLFSEHPEWTSERGPVEHCLAVPQADTFGNLLDDFAQSIRLGTRPLADARDQRHALACV